MAVNWVAIPSIAFALFVAALAGAPPPAYYPMETKIKFSPSMAITLICLVSAFFLLACFAVYLRHCLERRTARSFTLAADGVGSGRIRRRAAVRGLSPALLDSFPTFVYSDVKGHRIGGCALECAVCLNEFEDDEALRMLPKCSHVFHTDCIGAWLVSHVTCPVCRANLVPKPGRARTPSHVSDADPDDFPDGSPGFVAVDFVTDIDSADVINPGETPNQNRPSRMQLTKERSSWTFPRSHSTGHLLIRPGENCERYTLRLPTEVRNKLVNPSFGRTKSCVAFPGLRSSRRSYRTNSGGSGTGGNYVYYERFDRTGRSDRQGFTRARDEVTATSKKPVKSPFDRLFGRTDKDDVGERSFDRLRLDDET